MERALKTTSIILLLLICFSASVFMILESGAFFQKLYGDSSSSIHMGYWAAFLNEVFMGIMAGVWLPGRVKDKVEKVHPANILFKTLLVFLFVTTVFAASMNTIEPLLLAVQKQGNESKLIEIAKEQVSENQRALKTFATQNQRVNSALSFREQIRTREELKKLVSAQKSFFVLWAEIIVVLLIRFCVQLANLSCIWLVGWIYRQPPAENQRESSSKLDIVTPEEKSILMPKNAIPINNRTPPVKKASPPKVVPKMKTTQNLSESTKSEFIPKAVSSQHRRKSIPKVTNLKKPAEPFSSDTSFTRNQIVELLNSRNDGISLSEIGRAIGEKESSLRKIVTPGSGFDPHHLPRLEGILAKIEKLYQEEALRSY